MVKTSGDSRYERDWRVLKVVAAALWLAAGVTFLFAYYTAPQRDDIVLSGNPAAPVAPLHLAGSAAR